MGVLPVRWKAKHVSGADEFLQKCKGVRHEKV